MAADTLSGCQHFLHVRRVFPGAWRIYDMLNKLEESQQTPPLLPIILQGMLAAAWADGEYAFVAVTALAFHCMLRTIEFLDLSNLQIQLDSSDTGVVHLGKSKSGKRSNQDEMVSIEDPLVGRLLKMVLQYGPRGARVFPQAAGRYRFLFHHYLTVLMCAQIGFQPYSLRRGGATFDFSLHGDVSRTMMRGRWSAVKTAKIYINRAYGVATSLSLDPSIIEACQFHAAKLLRPN